MELAKLDTVGINPTSNTSAKVTQQQQLNIDYLRHEIEDGVTNSVGKRNEERKDSGCGSMIGQQLNNSETSSKNDSLKSKTERKRNSNRNKNKRKRGGRGKQKCNSKQIKKKAWNFPMPQRFRSNSNSSAANLANMTNILWKQIQRQRSIVPYNTNKFLMEEHLAEVPSALLTPNGRTRDSSFSIDSEDNYFVSLPEDEEEFLTKEFSNVYERARVERLEGMTKQQLIEECLQIEDRCSKNDLKLHQNTDFINKIKYLEDKVQRLNKENNELKKQMEHSPSKKSVKKSNNRRRKSNERMGSSEDSESDSSSSSGSSSSSSSSSSSCSSSSSSSLSEYTPPCSPNKSLDHSTNNGDAQLKMDTDEPAMENINKTEGNDIQNQINNGQSLVEDQQQLAQKQTEQKNDQIETENEENNCQQLPNNTLINNSIDIESHHTDNNTSEQ